MPQIYRRPAPSPRTSSEPRHLPQPSDADDSIILSDLVRTGEASRLRRRRAMRLDHGATRPSYNQPTQPGAPPTASSPPPPPASRPVFMPPPSMTTPPWVTPDIAGDDEDIYGGGEWRGWAAEDPTEASGSGTAPDERGTEEDMDSEEGFILTCGGEIKGYHDHLGKDRWRPFEPSPLPFSSCSASTSRRCTRTRPTRRTNGCGAIIHLRAFPQKQNGVWMGKEEATDAVTSMDAAYFDRTIVAKMMKSACGCIREGIGCSSCGNTLGTRYMPCQAASEGIFTNPSSSTHNIPTHPAGPSYWRGRHLSHGTYPSSSSGKSLSSFYLYTFFADHVTSIPACDLRKGRREHVPDLVSPPPQATSARPPSTWYGYPSSVSPQSMSPPYYGSSLRLPDPPSRTGLLPTLSIPPNPNGVNGQRPERIDESGAELDADGVVIETNVLVEPSSPDKIGNEIPWPGLR